MIVRSRIIPGVGITVAALMLAAVATRAVNADARFTQAGSDAFHRKLALIVQSGAATSRQQRVAGSERPSSRTS